TCRPAPSPSPPARTWFRRPWSPPGRSTTSAPAPPPSWPPATPQRPPDLPHPSRRRIQHLVEGTDNDRRLLAARHHGWSADPLRYRGGILLFLIIKIKLEPFI